MVIKKSVIKRAAAVSLSGTLSNIARRSYNVMLAHAYDELSPSNRVFRMSVKDFCAGLNIDSRNWPYIRQIVRELWQTTLEHDTLGIDGSGDWYGDNLLVAPRIKDGLIKWEYSEEMATLLKSVEETDEYGKAVVPYIIVNLLIHNNFTKHGLTLYELCLHWLPPKSRVGKSGFLSLTQVRTLFGSRYPQFGSLNREVLQKAIKNVNADKNKAPFTVKMASIKEGRSVCGVKFTVTRRDKVDLAVDIQPRKSFVDEGRKADCAEREKTDTLTEDSFNYFSQLSLSKQEKLWAKFWSTNPVLKSMYKTTEDAKDAPAVINSFKIWLTKNK